MTNPKRLTTLALALLLGAVLSGCATTYLSATPCFSPGDEQMFRYRAGAWQCW